MDVRIKRTSVRLAVAVFGLVWLMGSSGSTAGASSVFYDPEGKALPFASYGEVEQFLDEADVVWKAKIAAGTNKHKRKVKLQEGNLTAQAILRTSYELKDSPNGGFVDSYMSELAAYRLALLLGLDNVPPVVRRKGGGLQIWIEKATTDAARRKAGEEPADPVGFERQLMDMYVFDSLIANTDRNPGNILIDEEGKVWFIDQTRSFAGQRELRYLDKIEGCSRELWERLQSVSDEEIREAVRPYAKRYLDELLVRRRMLVDALQAKIEAGDGNFLYDETRP